MTILLRPSVRGTVRQHGSALLGLRARVTKVAGGDGHLTG